MAIYMNFSGIQGSVTAQAHENWIKLEKATWGSARAVTHSGEAAHRSAKSAVSIRPLVITKKSDSSSGGLLQHHLNAGGGETGKDVKIKWVTTSEGLENVVLELEFKQCIISSYTLDSTTEEHPLEVIELNFVDFTMIYHTREQKNTKALAPFTVSYAWMTYA